MRLTAAVILFLAAPATASAGCFESLGQTGCTDTEAFSVGELRGLSCQNLWYVRNSIYDDHGYCFRTAAAKAEFDNTGCYETDAGKLRFNNYEQTNINRIVQVEKEKGCRAP
jgi:hypothetical protein